MLIQTLKRLKMYIYMHTPENSFITSLPGVRDRPGEGEMMTTKERLSCGVRTAYEELGTCPVLVV